MPVTLSNPVNPSKTMQDLSYGEIGVITSGMCVGYVVFWRSKNKIRGFMALSPVPGGLLDGFDHSANHPIRILQPGESFTVTIP